MHSDSIRFSQHNEQVWRAQDEGTLVPGLAKSQGDSLFGFGRRIRHSVSLKRFSSRNGAALLRDERSTNRSNVQVINAGALLSGTIPPP